MKQKQNLKKRRNPTTKIVVMITACLVTLIGIATGLEPDVILTRCLIACVLTGIVTHISVVLLQMMLTPEDQRW